MSDFARGGFGLSPRFRDLGVAAGGGLAFEPVDLGLQRLARTVVSAWERTSETAAAPRGGSLVLEPLESRAGATSRAACFGLRARLGDGGLAARLAFGLETGELAGQRFARGLFGLGPGLGHCGVAARDRFGLEPLQVRLPLGGGLRLDLRHFGGHARLGVRLDERDLGLVDLGVDGAVLGPDGIDVDVAVQVAVEIDVEI